MTFDSLNLPVIILFSVTTLVLLIFQDWRVMICALGLQYSGVFILVGITWPLEMAVIKLVTGIIAAVVLGMELVRMTATQSLSPGFFSDPVRMSNRIFNLILAILIGLIVYSLTPEVAKWVLSATYYQIFGSLVLTGMGILIMGISNQPFRVIVGLFTFLSGFEILFATLDTSVLIAGFFSTLTLCISLLGAYLISTQDLRISG